MVPGSQSCPGAGRGPTADRTAGGLSTLTHQVISVSDVSTLHQGLAKMSYLYMVGTGGTIHLTLSCLMQGLGDTLIPKSEDRGVGVDIAISAIVCSSERCRCHGGTDFLSSDLVAKHRGDTSDGRRG